jgi:hypothetical protein
MMRACSTRNSPVLRSKNSLSIRPSSCPGTPSHTQYRFQVLFSIVLSSPITLHLRDRLHKLVDATALEEGTLSIARAASTRFPTKSLSINTRSDIPPVPTTT